MGQTTGTVREWHAELGWGVLDSPDTPGGCWAHYSNIDGTGFRALTVGATVDIDWEHAAQDGYRFRATRVKQPET
ncbi:cold shock domain-containing protein [Rhodococcus kronopolitis]|uniref:Cold shock domain-containing protein n=1 Tax=Rhodococcus kronopolitis TaxID=1460226 RepID=A0ABV9FTR4_9NOCA